MAARTTHYAETLSTTNNATTTFADAVTLSFTPEASTDYFLIWSARLWNSTANGASEARLYDSTGAAGLGVCRLHQKDTSDRETVFGIEKWTAGASPPSQTFKLQLRDIGGADQASCDNATLLVIKADAADQYAESENESTTTSASLQDKTTLTFTPGSQGDYLILATAEVNSSNTGNPVRAALEKGGTLYGDATRDIGNATNDYPGWAAFVKLTLTAASHTFKVQYSGTDGVNSGKIRNARIVALRLSNFANNYSAEARTRGTTTDNANWTDKVTLTATPAAARDHIVLACGVLDHSSATTRAMCRLDKGGVTKLEHIFEAKGGSDAANQEHAFFWMQRESLAASETTWHTAFKVQSGSGTTGFQESALVVIDLEEAGGGATPRTATGTLDAAIQQAKTATATLAAAIQAARSATGTLDASIALPCTASGSLDAAIRAPRAAAGTLDAAVRAAYSATASVDGALQVSRAASGTLDASVVVARQAFYAESLGESTLTSASFADKVSVTFTPDANSDYFVLWSCRLNSNSGSSSARARLYHDTAAATLREVRLQPEDIDPTDGDNLPVFGIDKLSFGASPAQQELSIEYCSEIGTASARISHASIVVLKADAADQYVESEGESSTGVREDVSFQDKATLTFTPASTGDYLVIAAAELGQDTTGIEWVARLYDGTNSYAHVTSRPQDGADREPWAAVVKRNLAAVAQTFKIQYATKDGIGENAYIRNAAILALRLDAFANVYSAESRGTSTTTQTTFQDKVTLTATPESRSHLVLAFSVLDAAGTFSAGHSAYLRFTKGGASQWEGLHAARGGTEDGHALANAQVQTLSAASTEWKLQYRTEDAASTAGTRDAGIVVLDLGQTAASGRTATAALDAAVRQARTASGSLDAAIGAAFSASASVDGAIQAPRTAAATLDSAIQRAASASATLAAAIRAAFTASATIDAVVEAAAGGMTAAATLDAAIQAARTASASVDAAVQLARTAQVSVDAAVRLARTASASVDAVVSGGTTLVATLDAAIRAARSASASLDAAIRSSRTASASLDAALAITRSATASVDAILALRFTAAATLEAAVRAAPTASTTLSAYIATTETFRDTPREQFVAAGPGIGGRFDEQRLGHAQPSGGARRLGRKTH